MAKDEAERQLAEWEFKANDSWFKPARWLGGPLR